MLDERAELLERNRLRQIVERASLERRYRVFRTAERRDDGDRYVEGFLSDVFDDAQSFAVRQPHVGQAQIEGFAVEQAQRVVDGFRTGGVETHARQRELEQFEQVGLVVYDKHFRLTTDSSGHEGRVSKRLAILCLCRLR